MIGSKRLQFLFGLVISGVLIAWQVATLDWRVVGAELAHSSYLVLLPATLVMAVHYWMRAVRWRYLLGGSSELSLRELFDALMIGNFASFVLPLRAGEFIRPYALLRRTGVSYASGFASIVIERFFDLATVLLTFSFVVSRIQGIPEWAYRGAFSLSVVGLGILGFILSSVIFPLTLRRLCSVAAGVLPTKIGSPIDRFLGELIAGTAALRQPKNLAAVVLLTAIVWVLCFLLYYLYLFIGGLPEQLFVSVAVTVIIALAVAAPSAPGFIGVYQTACIAGLALFGVRPETAMTYAIITHVHQYLLIILYGGFVLMRYNVRLSELSKPAAA